MRTLGVCAGLFVLLAGSAHAQGRTLRAAQSSAQQERRPNVILILSDDVGYGDLGSYGAPEAKTPNLDRLARQGVRFTESYANGSVCTPTRAALITGRYQQRVGLEWIGGVRTVLVNTPTLRRNRVGSLWLPPWDSASFPGLPVTAASLPALLKSSGYTTGLIGKWHLGERREMGPNAHGFDEFFGFLGGMVDYYTHRDLSGRHDLYEDTTEVQVPRYLTDEITRRAVGFVNRHAAGPFFLEVAYNATHSPFQPPDMPPSSAQGVTPAKPQLPGDSAAPTRQDYVRMLERMDQGVGEILGVLETRGLAGNTLVIFTSDNGGEWLSRNAPFFHYKGTLWEGGIRVPLIMRWLQHLPAGRTSRQVTVTMDLTASVLAATGTSAAADYPLDGINLLPMASGAKPVVERDLFWRIDIPTRVQRAVRSGPWKLLIDGEDLPDVFHFMLFNLPTDPGERHDLASQYPARVADLQARIAAWEREVAPSQRRQ
jgi:arylsulfatase A-like enzyme